MVESQINNLCKIETVKIAEYLKKNYLNVPISKPAIFGLFNIPYNRERIILTMLPSHNIDVSKSVLTAH